MSRPPPDGARMRGRRPKSEPVGSPPAGTLLCWRRARGRPAVFPAGARPGRMPPHDTRNFGLDLVRATAIALVLLSHGTNFIGGRLLWLGIDPASFWWLTGVVGVELFFALSGFLIRRIPPCPEPPRASVRG